MGERADAPAGILSLPQGGGSQAGIGAAFSADPFTGTGNIGLSIGAPAGRHGLEPGLSLSYSTGTGNGPFGLGWSLSIGAVTRKTSLGVPTYDDATDVFILEGADDLVPVEVDGNGSGRYRPRTDSDFALIDFDRAASRWTVQEKNGTTTVYDLPLADPADPRKVFSWKPTRVHDTFGNHVSVQWSFDTADGATEAYLDVARYIDYGDPASPGYLAEIRIVYADRPDPFTTRRSGFELRTRKRAVAIEVWTGDPLALNQRYAPAYDDSGTVTLLTSITRTGHDGTATQSLPPVDFSYTPLELGNRKFMRVTGETPPASLGNPAVELVDLFACGLLDVVEIDGTTRYWRNLGSAVLAPVRTAATTPGGFSLADPGVQLLDADGDGRADLVITAPNPLAGYFPLGSDGGWDARGFQRYPAVPSIDLKAPEVRLVDLTGDGVTDALRSGTRLECFFNSPDRGWSGTRVIERSRLDGFPDVGFDDQRVQLADMTGDGLTDIVFISGNSVSYWPSLGYGTFGARITMGHAPQLPDNADPSRLMLGDIDGDGCADLLYVGPDSITFWMNHGGNRWGDPRAVTGTPIPADAQGVRLVDFLGDGGAGVLWSLPGVAGGDAALYYLDLTGGRKPYLLERIDNHLGAVTTVEYRSSIADYLRDQAEAATRWRTSLPFPVLVVGSVTVQEHFSESSRTTSYRYHHGYWDGVEREFRGFGRVDQLDAAPDQDPIETRTWFHLGPVGSALDWDVPRFTNEYWAPDPDALPWPPLPDLDAAGRRNAARSLRGLLLRREVYGRDDSPRQQRPYSVSEETHSTITQQAPHDGLPGVFFPHQVAGRTTTWDRGEDPLTSAQFIDRYDEFGQPRLHTEIAVARGRDYRAEAPPGQPYLVAVQADEYAAPRTDPYIADRTCLSTFSDVPNDGALSLLALHDAILDGTAPARLVSQQASYYDGAAFEGLALGVVGEHGAPSRTSALAMTSEVLREAYASADGPPIPPYLVTDGPPPWTDDYPEEFRASLRPLAGFRYEDGTASLHEGYWSDDQRAAYDFQLGAEHPRGMVTASRDPLGNELVTRMDPYQFLTAEITSPGGLTSTIENDYRVMMPRLVTDANGNREQYGYSPLGDAAWRAVMGRPGEDTGDTPQAPSLRWETDYLACQRTGQPVSATTIEREYHVHDTRVPLPERDRTIITVSYLDGCGRMLQSRTQGDDVRFGDDFGDEVLPADQDAPNRPSAGRVRQDGDPAWVVASGRVVYDSKGQVVRLYRPFRSTGWDYQPQAPTASVTSKYDTLGREVERVNPDGSRRLTVYGTPASLLDPAGFAPTPWQTWFYDADDNAPAPNPDAGTPTNIEIDAMHRPLRSVQRLGTNQADEVVTSYAYDIRGNVLSVRDALGRISFRFTYDQAGRRLRAESIDAGTEREIRDAAGLLIERRTGRGELDLFDRDATSRPLRTWARDVSPATTVREQLIYGDDPASGLTPEQARARNCLGRICLQRDEAGLVTYDAYDFKGNITERVRQVTATGQPGDPGPRPWDDLAPGEYRVSTEYDAMNRHTALTTPAGPDGTRRPMAMRYGRGGGLTAVSLDGSDVVRRVTTDVLGLLTLVAFGNGVLSRWANNPLTLRAERIRSEPYALTETPAELTYAPTGADPFQDYGYRYDPIGNVTGVTDRTPGSGTAPDPGRLDRSFSYDPLYRLMRSTGRETPSPGGPGPWADPPRSASVAEAVPYAEKYAVDRCTNVLSVAHQGAADVTTTYELAPDSNRLASYTVGGTEYPCAYDGAGNLLSDGPGRTFTWGMANRLAAFSDDSGASEWHAYSASGQRVTTHRTAADGTAEVSVFVDALFELHRREDGAEAGVHISSGGQRAASLWVDQAGAARIEYMLADHLGSSNVVLDGAGTVTSREEYAPYGVTTFGGDPDQHYRYIDRQFDEVSSYYDFGARWYGHALARWASADPLGPQDEGNLFAYTGANPVSLRDPAGTNGPPKPLPPAEPEPVFTLDPTKSDVVQLYRYVSPSEAKYYLNLADRLSCAIHVDSKLMDRDSPSRWGDTYPGLEREVWNVFERYRGLHFGSNQGLQVGWEDVVSNYTGGKTGSALYTAARGKYSPYLNTEAPVDFKDSSWLRPPETHHLLYKSLFPDYAVQPWNLMLATRGNSSGTVGLHEMLHTVEAAGQGGIYTTLVPATRELVRSWAAETANYYPAPALRPPSSDSVVKLWSAQTVQPSPFSMLSSLTGPPVAALWSAPTSSPAPAPSAKSSKSKGKKRAKAPTKLKGITKPKKKK
jgi:RHS repeat-associated protein